jgi:hypothetical protein
MSALAARRAAAVANASASTSTTPEKITKDVRPKTKPVKPVQQASPPPSSDSEEELQAVLDTPNKRRKVDTPTASRPRYFAEPETVKAQSSSKRRQVKRFSPSAPVSDSESGGDSSVDGEADVEGDLDSGVVDWTPLKDTRPAVALQKTQIRLVGQYTCAGLADFEVGRTKLYASYPKRE